MRDQKKSGAILSYVHIMINCMLGLVYVKYLRDKLGQAEYGLYATVDSIIAYLAILDCGFGNAIIRYTARYRAEENKEKEYELNGMFLILYTIIGVVAFSVGMAICRNVGAFYQANPNYSYQDILLMKKLMSIMVVNVAITFPLSIFGAIITAYERFNIPKVLNIIRTLLQPCIMLPLLLLGYKSVALVVVTTILNLSVLIFNLFYCLKILKIKIKIKRFDRSLFREISIYAFYILLNILVDKIYLSTDNIILSIVVSKNAVAVYALAMQLYNYYILFSTAINGVFLPKLAMLVTESEKSKKEEYNKRISDIFLKVGRIQYMVVSLVLVGFVVVGKDFVLLWGGTDYKTAYYIELILMIPALIPLIQNIGISVLQAKNIHKFRSILYVFIAIANVGLTIPLAAQFAGVGAAIGTGIATLVGQGIVMNWYYYKRAQIDIPRFWKEIIRLVPNTIAFLIVGILLNYIWREVSYLAIGVKAVVCTSIYLCLLWTNGMNQYEKNLVRGIFERVRRIKGK